jgi:uncharacterized protein YodC (DUF2158 family)
MSFEPGSVVKLKSGSPVMTVEKIEEGKAWCHWFEGGKPQSAVLPVVILDSYSDEPFNRE